mmetsp:Transcript_18154/g.45129  ORF Transcript_18154/g.45129 Transcript_18154/m.45129 type:complete len:103 (-) Transcript_18154:64-372(-)
MVSAILAVGYLVVLIISGLVGFAAVDFLFKVVGKKSEEDSDTKEGSPIVESIKSAAMFVKMAALSAASSIVALVKTPEEPETDTEHDYVDVEMTEGPEVATC